MRGRVLGIEFEDAAIKRRRFIETPLPAQQRAQAEHERRIVGGVLQRGAQAGFRFGRLVEAQRRGGEPRQRRDIGRFLRQHEPVVRGSAGIIVRQGQALRDHQAQIQPVRPQCQDALEQIDRLAGRRHVEEKYGKVAGHLDIAWVQRKDPAKAIRRLRIALERAEGRAQMGQSLGEIGFQRDHPLQQGDAVADIAQAQTCRRQQIQPIDIVGILLQDR